MPENIYTHSALVERLKATKVLIGTDIDGTLTHYKPSHETEAQNELWQQEVQARKLFLDWCREQGPVGAISMRPGVLMMSQNSYTHSIQNGLKELPPKIGINNGKRFVQYPDQSEEHRELHDFDFLLPTGLGILVKKEHGYIPDGIFEQELDITGEWRKKTLNFLTILFSKHERVLDTYLIDIDREGKYEQDLVDVGPIRYRIQINFKNLEEKMWFKQAFSQSLTWEDSIGDVARGIELMDESKIDKNDATKNHYQLYVVPRGGTKRESFNYFLKQVCDAAGILPKEINVILTGDSMTDVGVGCFGGLDANVTFLLAGTRLTDFLLDTERTEFAGEDISAITQHLTKEEGKPEGFYILKNKSGQTRRIVFLSKMYPDLTAPESLAKVVEEYGEILTK